MVNVNLPIELEGDLHRRMDAGKSASIELSELFAGCRELSATPATLSPLPGGR
jgi:hypothetical protein